MGHDHHDHVHDHHDDDDELQPTIWMYSVLAASVPLFWMGNWRVGLCFVGLALLMFLVASPQQRISARDQLSIQYNIWSAEDVRDDLQRRRKEHERKNDSKKKKNATNEKGDNGDNEGAASRYRCALLVALPVLAKKYNKQHQQRKRSPNQSTTNAPASEEIKQDSDRDGTAHSDLALLCQQVVYMSLLHADANHRPDDDHINDDDDELVAASFALLALVAKNEAVRERHLHEADAYGLHVLTRAMSEALNRAQDVDDDDDDDDDKNDDKGHQEEQDAAELQRKGCLMLGALADGDKDVALQVVQDGGLKAILNAASWYRFHENVAIWALWAVFILCYENNANKVALMDLDGLSIVLQAMKNCSDSVEVTRHGIATVFDLLREDDENEAGSHPKLDIWKIRNTALSAGLHQIIVRAMEACSNNPNNMDIMLMGRELLVGTGYQGQIPEPITL